MIDNKGKLFGIINIVDLTVLIIVVLLIGAVGIKLLDKKSNGLGLGTSTEMKDILVHVKARLKTEEVAKSLNVGDRLVAKNTYINGSIESISFEDGDYAVPTDDGNLILTKHPLWKDIDVVLKVKGDVSGPTIAVGGQEIRVGRTYWVKTQKVEVLGEIESIEIR